MNNANALKVLYPGINLRRDVDLVDHRDGIGLRIDAWRYAQPQPTDAEIAAAEQGLPADEVFAARAEKALASEGVDRGNLRAGTATERMVVAVVQLVLDEFNRHSTFEASMLTAIAGASSLAELKSRMAAISPGPVQRTQAQLISAVKAKIAATGE